MKKVLFVFALPILVGTLSFVSKTNLPSQEVKASDSLNEISGIVPLEILNSGDYIYKEDDTSDEEQLTKERFNAWLALNGYNFYCDLSYHTTDTNETMVSQIELGTSKCDLMCPSEYSIQKCVNKGLLTTIQDKMDKYGLYNYENYSSRSIRKYLKDIKCGKNNSESLDEYAIGYMWGTLGISFNPDYQEFKNRGISKDQIINDFQTYSSLWDSKYEKSFLIKDSMRDTYFAGVSEYFKNETIDLYNKFNNGEITTLQYNNAISEIFNRCDEETMNNVKSVLLSLKKNAFGLEVDSGKQDIVVGNIGANLSWSGDAVYAMDCADEFNEETMSKQQLADTIGLCYSVPKYGSNVWSDCWCMPKNPNRSEKTEFAACLFLEFLCDPVIAADNMSWIGYTPYIGGDAVLEYARDCYDIRCDLIYNYDEEKDIYYDLAYLDPDTEELTEVWFEDCHYEEDADPNFDNVELYYGVLEFDEETGELTTKLEDLKDLEETYNERLIIDPEWEVIDLSYMFDQTLSDDYDESDYIFYSDNYLPFLNEDGTKNTCVGRQFFTQYPNQETIDRCVVMRDFGDRNQAMIQMWEDFKVNQIAPWHIIVFVAIIAVILGSVSAFFISKALDKSLRKARRENRLK